MLQYALALFKAAVLELRAAQRMPVDLVQELSIDDETIEAWNALLTKCSCSSNPLVRDDAKKPAILKSMKDEVRFFWKKFDFSSAVAGAQSRHRLWHCVDTAAVATIGNWHHIGIHCTVKR